MTESINRDGQRAMADDANVSVRDTRHASSNEKLHESDYLATAPSSVAEVSAELDRAIGKFASLEACYWLELFA